MCGAAITEFSRDFCNSAVTVGPISATVTNQNNADLGQYNEQQKVLLLPAKQHGVVVSCSAAATVATKTTCHSVQQALAAATTTRPVTVTSAIASCSQRIASDRIHLRNSPLLASSIPPGRIVYAHRAAEHDAGGARSGGRRSVRRELERRRRSLHAAGVEDLRRMLLPVTRSGPVSITQVLQEAVRVVLVAKAEERGALHAKEFLKEKRSYLQAKLANIKCALQPIDDDTIIKAFISKVRSEQRASRRDGAL